MIQSAERADSVLPGGNRYGVFKQYNSKSCIYQIWYVVGLFAGVLMMFSLGKMKKLITVYVCCYAGLVFGSLAGFRLFYNSTAFFGFGLAGMCILLILAYISSWGAEFALSWAVVAKVLLIFCAMLSDEMSGFTLWSCVIAGLIYGGFTVGISVNLNEKQKHIMWMILCGVFGVCEAAGSFVSLYRFPLESNLKFMMEENEYVNYFSTWLNCDFNIVGNQAPFAILLCFGFFVELIVLCIYIIRKNKKE